MLLMFVYVSLASHWRWVWTTDHPLAKGVVE